MNRRTVLLGAGAALPACIAAVSGCASVDWGGRETPRDETSPVETGWADYPHAIQVVNPLDRPIDVTLAVGRDGSTIYERTHEVAARASEVVAGFTRESFPPERRYVTIRASMEDGGDASVGVSVTDCLGDVVIVVTEGGKIEFTYSIC